MNHHWFRSVGLPVISLVAGVTILMAAACSKGPTPVLDDSEPGGSGQDQAENVTITFAVSEVYRSLIEPLMDEFNQQNPSITVQFVALPESNAEGDQSEFNYYQELASTADTLLIGGRSQEASAYVLDLQPQIDSDPSFEPDDFWPGALASCQDAEGHVSGVPLSLFFTGMFYDEETFDAAGLPYPVPGWTWDEFREDVSALSNLDGDALRYGYAEPPGLTILRPLAGQQLAERDGEIDVQALSDALQWYVDLAQAKALYPLGGFAGVEQSQQVMDQWNALFKKDEAPAMWYGRLQDPVPGAGTSSRLAVMEYGLVPLPIPADGSDSNSTPLITECAAISAGSSHPRAAWAWVNFLTRQWLVGEGSQLREQLAIPARRSVADSEGFWEGLPAGAQEAVRYGLEHAWYRGLYWQAENAALAALEKAAAGEADLAVALAEAKAGLEPVSQQSSDASGEVTVATPVPTPGSASNAVVVRFLAGTTSEREFAALKTLAEEFNQAHQDEIMVKLSRGVSSPDELSYENLAMKFDCFISDANASGAASSGVILGLNALMDTEDPAFRGDYDPDLLGASSYEGELYVLPFTSQPAIVAYNADLLARRGGEPPANDWTFNDFLQAVVAVTSTSEVDRRYGFLPASQAVSTSDMFLVGRGVEWLDLSGELPVANLDTPELANALSWMAGLYRSGALFQASSGEDWWGSITGAVQSGQIAFWTTLAGEQTESHFDLGREPAFKVGVAPLPAMPEGSAAFDKSINRGFYISRESENPQACWAWIKSLSEQPATFNGVPARQSVAASPAWEAGVGAREAEVYRLALARVQRLEGETHSSYLKLPLKSWMSTAEIEALNGNDPGPALAEAQRKADLYHDCLLEGNIAALSDEELREKVMVCARVADPEW